jgi:hypothetical protein
LHTTEGKDFTQILPSNWENHFLLINSYQQIIFLRSQFGIVLIKKKDEKYWIAKHEIQLHVQTLLHSDEQTDKTTHSSLTRKLL